MRETLGLGKDAPDEFVVVSRPPLSVPPDFELRPPGSGAQAAAPTPESNAQKTLLGTTAAAPVVTAPSSKKKADTGATATFLNKAGVDQATPDIRQQLGENAAKPLPAAEAGSLYEEMIGKEKTDTVVDAKKETKRLIENKEEGKPVTEGDTPTAAPASKSVWDRLF